MHLQSRTSMLLHSHWGLRIESCPLEPSWVQTVPSSRTVHTPHSSDVFGAVTESIKKVRIRSQGNKVFGLDSLAVKFILIGGNHETFPRRLLCLLQVVSLELSAQVDLLLSLIPTFRLPVHSVDPIKT